MITKQFDFQYAVCQNVSVPSLRITPVLDLAGLRVAILRLRLIDWN